ncbi:MAG: arsenate reductase (glutaredoxin) [Planctomycetes bacterium]|nr:arsenate reductase (glutaredoxin) [Planctomycetota bacterium]MCB9869083.1 arsenate reductase (glutaredoxin) [Planctomycetota bacterium]MCB9888041.1 arsenate reductase (glutaredoxin) [Planctomycetota bacterium]
MVSAMLTVWHNPACSNCRRAVALLEAHGIAFRTYPYLEDPPDAARVRAVLAALETTDPGAMIRTKEPEFRELGLQDATPEQLIEAMVAHPRLIQRPILVDTDRALVARPPELLLEFLDLGRG